MSEKHTPHPLLNKWVLLRKKSAALYKGYVVKITKDYVILNNLGIVNQKGGETYSKNKTSRKFKTTDIENLELSDTDANGVNNAN